MGKFTNRLSHGIKQKMYNRAMRKRYKWHIGKDGKPHATERKKKGLFGKR